MRYLSPLALMLVAFAFSPGVIAGQVGGCWDCGFQPWGWGCEGAHHGWSHCVQEWPGDCRTKGSACPMFVEVETMPAADGSGVWSSEMTREEGLSPGPEDSRVSVMRLCGELAGAREYSTDELLHLRNRARRIIL